jgi:hypothetical protein
MTMCPDPEEDPPPKTLLELIWRLRWFAFWLAMIGLWVFSPNHEPLISVVMKP